MKWEVWLWINVCWEGFKWNFGKEFLLLLLLRWFDERVHICPIVWRAFEGWVNVHKWRHEYFGYFGPILNSLMYLFVNVIKKNCLKPSSKSIMTFVNQPNVIFSSLPQNNVLFDIRENVWYQIFPRVIFKIRWHKLSEI